MRIRADRRSLCSQPRRRCPVERGPAYLYRRLRQLRPAQLGHLHRRRRRQPRAAAPRRVGARHEPVLRAGRTVGALHVEAARLRGHLSRPDRRLASGAADGRPRVRRSGGDGARRPSRGVRVVAQRRRRHLDARPHDAPGPESHQPSGRRLSTCLVARRRMDCLHVRPRRRRARAPRHRCEAGADSRPRRSPRCTWCDADGRELRRVTEGDASVGGAAWSRDGRATGLLRGEPGRLAGDGDRLRGWRAVDRDVADRDARCGYRSARRADLRPWP